MELEVRSRDSKQGSSADARTDPAASPGLTTKAGRSRPELPSQQFGQSRPPLPEPREFCPDSYILALAHKTPLTQIKSAQISTEAPRAAASDRQPGICFPSKRREVRQRQEA